MLAARRSAGLFCGRDEALSRNKRQPSRPLVKAAGRAVDFCSAIPSTETEPCVCVFNEDTPLDKAANIPAEGKNMLEFYGEKGSATARQENKRQEKNKHGIMQPEGKTNVQVPAVELHDPLLHLLLVRQQPVNPQEVPVCDIIVVADLRCCVTKREKTKTGFPFISH